MNETTPGRFSPPPPAELDDDQQAFYQRLVDGPRGTAGDVPLLGGDGGLLGPFAVMAIAPDVGEAVAQVGAAVRYATRLEPIVREAAVLLVASHHHSEFEWSAHDEPARKAGLDESQLCQLKAGVLPSRLTRRQDRALGTVHTMLHTGTLDEATYTDTVADLGERGLAELVWLTGYYTMLALALAVFDLAAPVEQR
ncbi:carboxymuconolactone decarboxylase family protein [Amycolatopsis sp. cmx-4-68]|uniref:carboxymuconolactone decarboxylase family protein n=1 Tax=Amycolatopsis sp. cmx-4-68 TaxID=2790938 RepID=UPI00397D9AD6